MMTTAILTDAFARVLDAATDAVAGLSPEQLADRVDAHANSIGWLVWHLARVQDDHVAGAFGADQVWTSAGWAERFGLPFPDSDIGYGHTSDQVAEVRADAEQLTGYLSAVHAATLARLREVGDDELQRVVDDSYDPPVTLGVRLVSVLSDDLQHAGQAAFLRGVVERSAG